MHYERVIPRDLFNEAKLLKCLGMLYLASEKLPAGRLVVRFADDEEGRPFRISQSPADGSIACDNVEVFYHGRLLHCWTPLNSKRPHPLYANLGDAEAEVFDEAGALSQEFLALAAAA